MRLPFSFKSLTFKNLFSTHVQQRWSMKPVLITQQTICFYLMSPLPGGNHKVMTRVLWRLSSLKWHMWNHSTPRIHIPAVAAIFKGCDVIRCFMVWHSCLPWHSHGTTVCSFLIKFNCAQKKKSIIANWLQWMDFVIHNMMLWVKNKFTSNGCMWSPRLGILVRPNCCCKQPLQSCSLKVVLCLGWYWCCLWVL